MKKLKDLLNEAINPQLGKVYSDPYAKSFVKENEDEESSEMTTEQKHAFLEAVKAYKSFGETVYRNEGLSEVYESIRGLVSVAGKNMVKETEGSFDGITVSRHVKRMNESFKIFEKTLREVATLQQRLESSYDEIGETLGKYYEINETDDSEIEEGNEFGAARAKAIAAGSDSFEVDGKTYPLKGVDKDDKENAKEFANESMNEGASTEEKRIVMLAIRKIAKYRSVPINQSVVDVQNAAEELERDIKKGKVKESKESMNLTDILKEGKDVGHYERVGNQTIVDSNFVNYSKGVLPNSELVHLGMGDFAIKSQSGTIKFNRSGKMDGIGQDFVGRPHRMTDDKNGKLVDLFLKLMLKKKKAIISMSESVVNETRLVLMPKPDKGLSIGKQQELAKDILTFIDKSTKINLDYKKRNAVYKSRDRVYIELFPKTNSDVKIIHKFLDKMYPQFKIDESVVNEGMAGWIAIDHKGNKLEIKKSEAKDLYNAKLLAIKKLKVPKSKVGMLAIKPAVDESITEARESAKNLLQSVVDGETKEVEGIKLSKEMAEAYLNWLRMSPFGKKYGKLPFNKLFTASFRWGLHRHADEKSKEYKDLKAKAKGFDKKNESTVNEAKYDIGMARKGNGLTIYNKAEEENGDYKNVAHIDNKGKIKYLDKKIPSNIKKEIEAEAKKMMEITNEGNTMIKLKNLLNESMGLGDLPSSKLMKMKVSAKDMLASVGSNNINESEEDESANEDVYVKNKKTGNTYAVKNADPSKHVAPSEKDVAKAKSDAKDEPNRSKSDAEDEPVRDDNTDGQIQDTQDEIKSLDYDEMEDYADSDIYPYLKGKDLDNAKELVRYIGDGQGSNSEKADYRKGLSDLFDKKMTLESVNETKKRFKKLANIIKG